MYSSVPSHLLNSPIYQKAIEILLLSRRISSYFIYDLNCLKQDGKEDESIYFTGDIIQQSGSLVPEIIKAESEVFSENKHKHAHRLEHLINLLIKNCSRLERTHSNGTDFIPVLRKELNLFKKIQNAWTLTL
ncbi:hypothetical protein N8768_02725 [Flavobacteriaceae bacterium]|jgi:hypothetical protein|nr:hypothetical protein [Flavobacteriaceae bacterium]